ncbi:MAG: hypothetical protein Kow006_26940 [Gammaproteobacteria bacterium]
MSVYALDISWNGGSVEDRRFKRIVLITFLFFLAASITVSVLPVFKVERPPVQEVPKRIAKLVLQKRKPAPPPPPPKVEKPKPEPKKVEKPKPKPEKIAKKEKPKPKEPPKAKPKPSARERAERAGIMAFRDTLAELRQDPSVAKLAGGKRLTTAGKTARKTERSMVTSRVGRSSGGINTARLSRDTGSTQLATRSTEQLKAPTSLKKAAQSKKARQGKLATRTDEEIQLVFDRNKTAIYNLYNRALRTNPAMKGKVVIRLTISPDGKVTNISIVSSELGDQKLERKLVLRVKRFRFEPKNVAATTLNYTMDFFPS